MVNSIILTTDPVEKVRKEGRHLEIQVLCVYRKKKKKKGGWTCKTQTYLTSCETIVLLQSHMVDIKVKSQMTYKRLRRQFSLHVDYLITHCLSLNIHKISQYETVEGER